jgi:hypothetical protein
MTRTPCSSVRWAGNLHREESTECNEETLWAFFESSIRAQGRPSHLGGRDPPDGRSMRRMRWEQSECTHLSSKLLDGQTLNCSGSKICSRAMPRLKAQTEPRADTTSGQVQCLGLESCATSDQGRSLWLRSTVLDWGRNLLGSSEKPTILLAERTAFFRESRTSPLSPANLGKTASGSSDSRTARSKTMSRTWSWNA